VTIERQFQPWSWRARLLKAGGWRVWLLLLASGAFSALAMAPLNVWPALIPGLTVLIWCLDGSRHQTHTLQSAFWRGYLFGMGYFIAGTFWVGFAFLNRGGAFWMLIPLALPAFASLLAVFWGFAGMLYSKLSQRSEWRILVFAASFALFEWLRGHIFSGLPWNLPGYTWTAGGAISQSASWFGIYGLTFLTLFALASPAVAISRHMKSRRLMPPMAGIGLLLLVFLAGMMRLGSAEIPDHEGLRFRIVHSSITQAEKWGPNDFEARTRDRYLRLTQAPGLDAVTHVLWPEGALPYFMLEDGETLRMIGNDLQNGQVLLAGINRRAGIGRDTTYHNSLAVLRYAENGAPRVDALYDKVRLVPFGETIPLAWLISAIGFEDFARLQFAPGPGPAVSNVAGAPSMMPLICYEAIFPEFVRSAPERPGWLYNLSNDAWFGDTSGPWQHLNQTRYRAIETGLPILRVASRGYSGAIDPLGRMPLRIAPDDEGAYDTGLPLPLASTLYWRYGDLPFWFITLSILGLITAQRFRFMRKQKRSQP